MATAWETGYRLEESAEAFQPSDSTIDHLVRKLIQQENLVMRGTMAACVGHELNNQLTVTYGNIEMALQSMDKQEWATALERIRCAAKMLQNTFVMTQALFSGTLSDTPLTFLNMNDVVADFLFVLKPMIRKHKAAISFSAAEQLPLVKANESQMRQVLYNLIRNAIQTRPEINIKIKTTFNSNNQMVNCQITDNGPGMDRAALTSIFSPFHTGRDNGHGLGLYICKEIIARCQGSLTVQSRVGDGACFTISLPARNL